MVKLNRFILLDTSSRFAGLFARVFAPKLTVLRRQLLFDPVVEHHVFDYIADVAKRMMHAAATPEAVFARLYIGWRHFFDPAVTALV